MVLGDDQLDVEYINSWVKRLNMIDTWNEMQTGIQDLIDNMTADDAT